MQVEIPYLESPNDTAAYHGDFEVRVNLSGPQLLALHRVRAALIDAGASAEITREAVIQSVADAIAAAAAE